MLCAGQGRLGEAEEMYQRAPEGYKKAFGQDHTSTLNTVYNLGLLFFSQDDVDGARAM